MPHSIIMLYLLIGCEGGFPYLIGGKYAEDFGLVQEVCNPYKGVDHSCSTIATCPRQYSTKYEYIGGFYGAYVLARLSLFLSQELRALRGFYEAKI